MDKMCQKIQQIHHVHDIKDAHKATKILEMFIGFNLEVFLTEYF